jgi:membrane protease YdiL (CAAX protease family)
MAGWPVTRLIVALLMVAAGVNAARAVLRVLARHLTGASLRQDTLAYAIPIVLAAHFSYLLYVKLVERRRVAELGSRGAVPEVALGVLTGAVLFAATIGAIALLGDYRVTGVNGWRAMAGPFAMAVGSGYAEELVFRGVLFRIVEDGLGTWWALAISSALFGLAHAANPHATAVSTVAIMLEAGVLLGAAFVLTRRLWLPVGIHFAWNFTQGGIFGVNVSGYAARGLLRGELTGSVLLSGGSLVGAEGSLFALLFCLAVAVWFLVEGGRRGHFKRPFWSRHGAAASA